MDWEFWLVSCFVFAPYVASSLLFTVVFCVGGLLPVLERKEKWHSLLPVGLMFGFFLWAAWSGGSAVVGSFQSDRDPLVKQKATYGEVVWRKGKS